MKNEFCSLFYFGLFFSAIQPLHVQPGTVALKHAVANEGYQCHVFGLNLIEMSLFPMLSESLDQLINKISDEYAA